MNETQASRYLDLLGLERRPPSVAALTGIVTAHLARVPFENVSKLIRHGRGRPPVLEGLDTYLDRIEFWNLGGTCYACAIHLNGLLRRLGYQADLCGAAMDRPDVHAVNQVTLDGRPYLVDVGFAAPFFAPLPLDAAEPVTVSLGAEDYRLHPRDPGGRHRLDHLRNDAVIHGYTIDPTPRDAAHFAAAIAHSYRPDSSFLNRLRMVRHTPARSIALRDFTVTVTEGATVRERTLAGPAALADVVEVLLGVPAAVTAEALAILELRSS